MIKELADKKLKIFYGNENYKNMIYYILFVFIIQSYAMNNFVPLLSNIPWKAQAAFIIAKQPLNGF